MYNSLIPWLYQLTFVTPCWWTIVHIPVFVGLSSSSFIIFTVFILDVRTVLRGYQRSYQKLYIEVEQTMQWSKEETKEQTTIYEGSHRKLKIEQHESHQNSVEKSGAQEWYSVPAPHVTPVVLLLLKTRLYVMNEERTGLCFRQTEHTRGHLEHRYSAT